MVIMKNTIFVNNKQGLNCRLCVKIVHAPDKGIKRPSPVKEPASLQGPDITLRGHP